MTLIYNFTSLNIIMFLRDNTKEIFKDFVRGFFLLIVDVGIISSVIVTIFPSILDSKHTSCGEYVLLGLILIPIIMIIGVVSVMMVMMFGSAIKVILNKD